MIEIVFGYFALLVPKWWVLIPGLAAEIYDVAARVRGQEFRVTQRRIFHIAVAGLIFAQFLVYLDVREKMIAGVTLTDQYTPLRTDVERDAASLIRAVSNRYPDTEVVISYEDGSPARRRVALMVEDLVQKGGFVAALNPYSQMAVTGIDPSRQLIVPAPVIISASTKEDVAVEDLAAALSHVLRCDLATRYRGSEETGIIQLSIAGDPLFFSDGTVTFKR